MIQKTWLLSLCTASVAFAAIAFAVQGDTTRPETGHSQDGHSQDGHSQDGAMMGAKPGEHHKVLERMVGTWDASMSFPGADGLKGVETNAMQMNGLWLVGDFEMADFMGAPFSGHSVIGYDARKQKYVGMWVDSFTDRITTSEGDYDRANDRLVMHAENLDHMTGELRKERHITEFKASGARTFKMIGEGSDEPDMVIEYTRRK
jgi:hypothetical protein